MDAAPSRSACCRDRRQAPVAVLCQYCDVLRLRRELSDIGVDL